ncbi:hypothetical protein EJB05_38984, partial [Eragrostis curvula]
MEEVAEIGAPAMEVLGRRRWGINPRECEGIFENQVQRTALQAGPNCSGSRATSGPGRGPPQQANRTTPPSSPVPSSSPQLRSLPHSDLQKSQMACTQPIATGLASYGLYAESRAISRSFRNFPRKSSYKFLRIRAVQGNDGRRKLVDIIRIIPELSRDYFRSRSRRALFGGISLLGGFYVAQTISLSFGALGVNDVIASVVCVLLAEYVTKFYYSRPKVTFPVALLNNFKMGFTYGLFIDAFKLAS